MFSLKFVTFIWVTSYFREHFKILCEVIFLNAETLKIIRNYYDPLSVIFIAITIYSALSYVKIIELANTFFFFTYILSNSQSYYLKCHLWKMLVRLQ